MKNRDKLLDMLSRIPEVKKLLTKYNISTRGRKLWIENVVPGKADLHRVRVKIDEINPALYLVADVIVDDKANIVRLVGKPSFANTTSRNQ